VGDEFLTHVQIRDHILALMSDPAWGRSLTCLARALGYKKHLALVLPTARWRTLKLKDEERARIEQRLKMILSGEIRPTPVYREIPAKASDTGPVPPKPYLDWLPAVSDDAWRAEVERKRNPIALSISFFGKRFKLNHERR
jgi:hypothetical protein